MSGSNERWSDSRQVSVPNRSGSAPPSMEGSFLAVNNLLSPQGSSGYNNLELPSYGFEEPVTAHPSYPSKHNLNRIPSPPIYYPTEYQLIDNGVGRFRSNWGISKVNAPILSSQATLSTHKEVSEDEGFQQPPVLSVSDRINGLDIRLSPGSQGLEDFRQDDSSSGPTPQYSQSNSSNGEMNTADDSANFSEMSDDVMVKDNTAPTTRASIGDEKSLDESTIISKMKNTNISGSRAAKYPQEPRYARPERELHQQLNNVTWIQGGGKKASHGVNDAVTGTGQFLYGQPNKFSGDGQPMLRSSGFTPPQLYPANQETYLTSPAHVYNMQSAAVYSPQYGCGPYTNMTPQFIHGFPSHTPIPLIASPDFIPQLSDSSAGSVVHGSEIQYAKKLYVSPGQPSYPYPMYMQYCQQFFKQMDPLAPRNHKNAPDSQRVDLKFVRQTRGPSNSNRVGMVPNYHGIQPNMGIMVQYLPTQLGTPLSPGSVPYVNAYPGWQPHGTLEGVNGPRLYSFLEKLKSGRGRRFDLSDITGHIVEFSADQHGSRFIQQKLAYCNPEEKAAVFREVLPHACKLVTDIFGNYVIQKLFEYGNSTQRKELTDQLMGQIVPLSLQMCGCRVIQKALDVIELDQRVCLARELDGQVIRCVRDQNGNHVIQKCMENIPAERIGFMLHAFHGQVSSLAMHPYGCRVIQVLDRCSNEHQCQFITQEILESVCVLSKDQYGNYVIQYVLEKGTSEERETIVRKLSGHIMKLSLHKFASNVIEKCLEYGGQIERELIIKEIAGPDETYDSLLMMMKDQYGNYVVQKILETCTDDQRTTLFSQVRMHASALKKYTYGKHIVTRLEQPFGEGTKTPQLYSGLDS